MVTMKEVANACNVSVATVSKALKDYSDISDKTKALVEAKAAEMGYFPNYAAIALKTNKTKNIGIIYVDDTHTGFTHEYFAKVLESFKVAAEEAGYDITFVNNRALICGRHLTYAEHCRYRKIDGVAIVCINFDDPEVVELVNSGIPVVTIDHIFNNTMSVVSDNVQGVKDLVEYVHSKGHKRIAFIHGADSAVTSDRVKSFYKTTSELGLDISEDYVLECPYRDTKRAGMLTEKLLDMKEPPTCILFPDDFTAIGGINVIKERGLKIPEDISVVGYDGISYAKVLDPKLTTLEQDTDMLGSTAAKKLIELIETPKTTIIERVVVEGKVLVGESVKDVH